MEYEIEAQGPDLREYAGEMRRRCSRLGWAFFVYMLLAQAGSYGLTLLYAGWQARGVWPISQDWTVWLLSYLPTYLVAFPVFLLLMKRIPAQRPAARKKVRPMQFAGLAAVSFGMMYAANIVTVALLSVLEALTGTPIANPLEQVAGANLPTAFFGVLFAPVLEELTFRGLLLNRLRGYGEGICILASGFVFGLFHGNLSQMLYAFVLGCIFGYVALRTGGVRVTILLHMLVNLVGTVAAPALVLSGDLLLTAALGVFVIGTVAASIIILLRHRAKIRLYPGPSPLGEREKRRCFFLSGGMIAYILLIIAVVVVTGILLDSGIA